jgi:glucokinase
VQQGKRSALTHIVAGNLANMKSSDLADALAQDDKVAKRVLKRAAEYLGYGIASAINLFDPDMIILGGGVVEALGDTFINWASKVARPNCICVAARDTPIVAAALGDDAGMLGAALLARGNGG